MDLARQTVSVMHVIILRPYNNALSLRAAHQRSEATGLVDLSQKSLKVPAAEHYRAVCVNSHAVSYRCTWTTRDSNPPTTGRFRLPAEAAIRRPVSAATEPEPDVAQAEACSPRPQTIAQIR